MDREAWRAVIHGVAELDMTERLIWSDLKKSTQGYITIKLLKDKGKKKKCILKLAKVKVKAKSLNHVRLFATPWTIAYQAPQFMEFSRQEYWSGFPFPSPRELADPGIEPRSPALQADTLTSESPGKSKQGKSNI